MANEYIFLETKQYKDEVPKWLQAIKRQENATVLFVPKTDRLIRLNHLLQDKTMIGQVLGDPDKYIFLRVTFDLDMTHELQDVSIQICEQLNLLHLPHKTNDLLQWMDYFSRHLLHLVLVLPEAEIYLTPEHKQILSLVSEFSEKYAPITRILCFFESNFTHPHNFNLMPVSTRLYENIFLYPLYTPDDTVVFIKMLEGLWDLHLSEKARESIMQAGGGHFWLVKQAVREVSSFGDWKTESEGMMFRLRTIFNSLMPSERSLIQKLVTDKQNFNQDEEHSLKYFNKMRFTNERKACLIGGFSDLLLRPHVRSEEITLKDNRIYVNEVLVDNVFAKTELRVLKLLLKHDNQVVDRESIAQSMWPMHTEKEYSDWAIDQLIARLRKRLKELSFSPKLLEVIRGKGYRFKLPQSLYDTD